MTTVLEQPTFREKTWEELSEQEWNAVRTTDSNLWWRLVQASEGMLETKPEPVPTAVPTTLEEVTKHFSTAEQTKAVARKTALACGKVVLKRVGKVLNEKIIPRLNALEAAPAGAVDVSGHEARIAGLEDRASTFAQASSVSDDRMRMAGMEHQIAGFEDRLAALNGKLDKEIQTNSAQSRHIQALEKKLGVVINGKGA